MMSPTETALRKAAETLPQPLNKALTTLAERDAQAREAERERWLKRYIGLFGEPSSLPAYRAGTITFRELVHSAMGQAERMVAEAQYLRSDAFNDED